MTLESIAPLLAGPAAAVLVMMLVFAAVYQVTTKQLIPLASSWVDRHLSSLDDLVKGNREDHAAMIASLNRIESKIDRDVTNPGIINGERATH